MRTRWTVRITKGFGRGIHTFRTRRAALDFIAAWSKVATDSDAAAALFRNGIEIEPWLPRE